MPSMQKDFANEAAMQPAKVYIGEDSGSAFLDLHRELRGLERQKAELMAAAMQMQLRLQPPACALPQPALHSGEWVQAVTETIPYLDQAGIYEALSILDRAVLNVQHAKAIESMMAESTTAATSTPTIEIMQAQVNHSHQLLLQQLMLLRTRSVCGAAACLPFPGLSSGLEGLFEDTNFASQAEVYAAQELLVQQHEAQVPLLPSSTQRAPAPVSQGQQAQMPPKQSSRGGAQKQVQTLSTSLQMLSREDADVLLIVRRINKLGFKAGRRLKQHFSQYGTVIRVLVAHSTCRPSDSGSQARKRPSSLGFIHMAKPQDVAKILSMGSEHEVEGVCIRVQRFERQHEQAVLSEAAAAAAACEEDGLEEVVQGHAKNDGYSWWQQSASSKSSASTAASSSDSQCDSWPSP